MEPSRERPSEFMTGLRLVGVGRVDILASHSTKRLWSLKAHSSDHEVVKWMLSSALVSPHPHLHTHIEFFKPCGK